MSDPTSEARPATYRTRRGAGHNRVCDYTYRKGFVLSESISIKGEQRQQKMLDVTGVMEVRRWGDEERFEAAVHTEEGPKSLKGTVVTSCSCIDIQSGAIPRWQVVFKEADQAIRKAYDTLEPREATRVISTIWEQLDRTGELAAARSRLLIGKLEKPTLAPLPKWFQDQRAKLFEADEDELPASPLAIGSAELLVRAAIAALSEGAALEAEIDSGPRGRVTIDWNLPRGWLQWMVEAIEIPWPSVKVYQVSQRPSSTQPSAFESRILYNAFDVIDSFVGVLSTK